MLRMKKFDTKQFEVNGQKVEIICHKNINNRCFLCLKFTDSDGRTAGTSGNYNEMHNLFNKITSLMFQGIKFNVIYQPSFNRGIVAHIKGDNKQLVKIQRDYYNN